MKNYMRGMIDEELSIGTLASKTLITAIFDDVVASPTLISSIVASYVLSEVTAGTAVGPLLVGVAHSDYSDAEIEAVIENVNSWQSDDLIGKEVAGRLVRVIGTFTQPPSATESVSLNDGKPIKTKLNWRVDDAESLRMWAYNLGAAAFATTNPAFRMNGHANLWSI